MIIKSKRKNIVILHGWGASVAKFIPLKENLEKLGWNVYVVKLPGFDLQPPEFAWDLDEYSEYVLSEAKKYFKNDSFFVFGHSFGGGIAIKLSLKEKQIISGIVLCANRGISRSKSLKRYLFWVLAKTGKLLTVFPRVAAFYKKLLYKLAREHDYEKTSSIMREIFKKVISEDLKPIVNKIEMPALILWGKLDKMTPVSDAYLLNKKIRNSKLVLFDDVGHRLPYEKAKELAEEIDKWIQNLK